MDYLQLVKTTFFGRPWTYAKVSEQLIIMLVMTKSGKFVCISQSRPAFIKRVLSPVMGTFHETDPQKLLETAAKEIKSETGHDCFGVEYIMTIARSSGLTDETAHLYAAIVEDEVGAQDLHPEEDIKVIYFDSKEAILSAIKSGEFIIDSALPYFLCD